MNKAIEMAKYAYHSSFFYRNKLIGSKLAISELNDENWKMLPLINKEMIVKNPSILIADDYIVKNYHNELASLVTSGSTGTYLDIVWDSVDINKSLSSLWLKRYREFGIKAHDKYCYFFNSHRLGWKVHRYDQSLEYALGIYSGMLTYENLKNVYYKIKEFSPKWLLLQPSIANILCFIKEKYNLSNFENLNYIELTGEMVSQEQEKRISKIFQCKVRNQYGCNEAFSIAYECSNGQLHINSENVYVEVIDDEGNILPENKEGEIYITSLNNYAMPFVRYEIGDRGKIIKKPKCMCGKNSDVLELTSGRSSDVITLESGEYLSAYTFARTIRNINTILDTVIYQYQIEQRTKNIFIIWLVSDKDISEDLIIQKFLECLNEPLLSEVSFEFNFVDYIPVDERTGKARAFINRLKGEE